MAPRPPDEGCYDDPEENNILAEAKRHRLIAAAIIGGAAAAAAGAYLGTRALARRNAREGKPLNSVMATAITATAVSKDEKKR
jgi:hypothetical protein